MERYSTLAGKMKPVVFVHIPKTAGSTLYSILRDSHGLSQLYKIHMNAESLAQFHNLDEQTKRKLRVIYGHVDMSVANLLPPDAMYVTMVREPIDRVISYYYYTKYMCDDQWHEIALRTPLERFIPVSGIKDLDNGMVRRLSGVGDGPALGECTREMLEHAKRNADRFSLIGLTTRFDESYALMAKLFGWPIRCYRREKHNRRRPVEMVVAPAVREQLMTFNALDQELYRYCAGLFEKQLVQTDIARELEKIQSRCSSAWYGIADITRKYVVTRQRQLAKKLPDKRHFG